MDYTVKFTNVPGTCTHYETRIYGAASQMVALTQATADFVSRNTSGRKGDMTDEQMKSACVHITPFE